MSCEVRGGNPRELKAEDLIFVPTVDLQSIKELPLGIQRKNGDYVRNFFFFLNFRLPFSQEERLKLLSGNTYSKTSLKTRLDFVQTMLTGFMKQGPCVHIHHGNVCCNFFEV